MAIENKMRSPRWKPSSFSSRAERHQGIDENLINQTFQMKNDGIAEIDPYLFSSLNDREQEVLRFKLKNHLRDQNVGARMHEEADRVTKIEVKKNISMARSMLKDKLMPSGRPKTTVGQRV